MKPLRQRQLRLPHLRKLQRQQHLLPSRHNLLQHRLQALHAAPARSTPVGYRPRQPVYPPLCARAGCESATGERQWRKRSRHQRRRAELRQAVAGATWRRSRRRWIASVGNAGSGLRQVRCDRNQTAVAYQEDLRREPASQLGDHPARDSVRRCRHQRDGSFPQRIGR